MVLAVIAWFSMASENTGVKTGNPEIIIVIIITT